MTKLRLTLSLVLGLAALACPALAQTGDTPSSSIAPRSLLPEDKDQVAPDNDNPQVTTDVGKDGIAVTIQPGESQYPGLRILPSNGQPWDLGAFGHIEAKITNSGSTPVTISLRVDGNADWKENPYNTESITLKPGENKILKVIFGYSYGGKPAFKMTPSVKQLLFFSSKRKDAATFHIDEIWASGAPGEKPPVNPGSVRIVPPGGVIFGPDVSFDAAKQIDAFNGATASVAADSKALQVTFAGGKDEAVTLKPAEGKWRLVDYNEVKVTVKNTGTTPATPIVRLTSGGTNTTSPASPASPLAPGATSEITVSFIPAAPAVGPETIGKYSGNKPGSGTTFESDSVAGVSILSDKAQGPHSLEVSSIKGGVSIANMPDWVGKRPPEESGDWVKTFDDEFDGSTIDLTKWNIYAANFWDKRTHFSKDNVIVKDGKAILRYEKKTGNHNDSPSGKVTDYASGFADTFGKWTQRYGYFEARMKLPKSPGLWPAFWLMPDRGIAAGEQWKRASTGDGGMEFDIMEFLSGWGPYRYNIAMHMDGYGKDHKAVGSTCNYCQPDAEGYITCGLLWTPGSAIYYCNGREVYRLENPRVSNVQSDIMFTAVSGGWANTPLEDDKLPDDFIIDYVRVWQRKDLATPEDGPKPNEGTPDAPKAAPAAAPAPATK